MKVTCTHCGCVSREMSQAQAETALTSPCPGCGRKDTVFDIKEVQMEQQKLRVWTAKP